MGARVCMGGHYTRNAPEGKGEGAGPMRPPGPLVDLPELARVVPAGGELGHSAFRSAVDDVEAHAGATELGRKARPPPIPVICHSWPE